MPVIDIHGDKKKVACGPCIRGHRSSKCTHSDRVLIEVRKPGRPLSACPHPSGSCGCQRAVFYTVPKSEATPSGSLSPTGGLYAPSTPVSSNTNRVQKPKFRKNSTSVNTSTVQRALEGDPALLTQQTKPKTEVATATELSESSSNVPSLNSSTSSTPQTEAVDRNMQLLLANDLSAAAVASGDSSAQPNRLQLGIGGYGTTPDDLGWSGSWPDYNSITFADDKGANGPSPGSCCGQSQAAPKPQSMVTPRSCCAPKAAQPLPEHRSLDTQPFMTNSHSTRAQDLSHMNLSYPSYPNHFALPGPAFGTPVTDSSMFVEDQFGCTHQPDHTCQCGEGCECLGCSMHPANRTTTDYVRFHTELAMRGYAGSGRMQVPPSVTVGQQSPHFANLGTPMHMYSLPGAQGVLHQHFPTPINQSPYLPQWHQGPHALATPTLEMSQFSLQNTTPSTNSSVSAQQSQLQPRLQSSAKGQDLQKPSHARQLSQHESNTYDHESPSTEDDTSTLSPSAFSVQQFSIPGCNDVTGSCLCGDGCQCEGCLTHNGHDRESTIENLSPAAMEHDASLPGYASTTEMGDHGFVHGSFDDILRDPLFAPLVPG